MPVCAGTAQPKPEVDKGSLQEVEAALKGCVGKWPSINLTEEEEAKWREDLFRSEARPIVQEEIRLAVDAEMRESLHRSKVLFTVLDVCALHQHVLHIAKREGMAAFKTPQQDRHHQYQNKISKPRKITRELHAHMLSWRLVLHRSRQAYCSHTAGIQLHKLLRRIGWLPKGVRLPARVPKRTKSNRWMQRNPLSRRLP